MKLGAPLFDAAAVVVSDLVAGEAVPASTPPPTPGLNPLRNLILGFLGGSPIKVGLGVAAAAAAGSLGPIINGDDDDDAAELSLERTDLLAAAEARGDGRSASTVAAGGDFVSGL